MIKNIKDILCTEEIYVIYSACMFEPTFDKFKIKAQQMQKDSSVSVYGYFLDEKIIGVISTQETNKAIEIIGISVDTKERHSGIGTKLIDYIRDKCQNLLLPKPTATQLCFIKNTVLI